MKKLFSLLIFFIILVGCKQETRELEFEEYHAEAVSDKNCNPDEENCAFVTISVPLASVPQAPETEKKAKKINDEVQNHIVDLINFQEEKEFSSLEELARQFINNYEAEETEFPEYHIPWEASVEGEVTYKSPELITIQFEHAQFAGGAHGYTSVSYLNFDPKNGNRLFNKDLFTEEFTNYVEELFRKKFEIPENMPLNSTGFFFTDDRFYLPQNSGIVKDKLVLRYNAYEIASYSEGAIKLEIPLEEAKPYLKIF